MAAFGILAALRERDASGEGQFVDISMKDGALSWLAMDAARVLAGAAAPARGGARARRRADLYRPYRCADGWVTLGALEPKFWQAWCHGVGREDLADRQFDAIGSVTHHAVEQEFAARTRDEWEAFNDEHDCCVEPVLELDEALVRARRAGDMVVELEQRREAGRARHAGPALRTPADPTRAAGPALRRAHRRGADRGRLRPSTRSGRCARRARWRERPADVGSHSWREARP